MITSVPIDNDTGYNCARNTVFFDAEYNSKTSERDTQNAVSAASNYKIYVDKHVTKFLTFKREIGTVLHIRNLKAGLYLYKNIFNENIGSSGTNLLLEDFENTQ